MITENSWQFFWRPVFDAVQNSRFYTLKRIIQEKFLIKVHVPGLKSLYKFVYRNEIGKFWNILLSFSYRVYHSKSVKSNSALVRIYFFLIRGPMCSWETPILFTLPVFIVSILHGPFCKHVNFVGKKSLNVSKKNQSFFYFFDACGIEIRQILTLCQTHNLSQSTNTRPIED